MSLDSSRPDPDPSALPPVLEALPELEPVEAERYELEASPAYHFDLARRDLFRLLGGLGILLVTRPVLGQGGESGGNRGGSRQEALPDSVGAWLHIGEDGGITAYSGKVEVGQNIRTSLAQAVADELFVAPQSVRFVLGDTQLCPYDRGTFGSRTSPTMAPQMRKAAAAARQLLIGLAAEQWQVPPESLAVEQGHVVEKVGNRRLSYGELTRGQRLSQSIPVDTGIQAQKDWKSAGRSIPRIEGRDFVTGKHRYPSDQTRPGMLFGKILRPPSSGAVAMRIDSSEAERIPGVVVVRDGDLVGVAAPDELTAVRALDAIRAEWRETAQPMASTLFDYFKKNPAGEQGGNEGPEQEGLVEKALAEAEHTHRATYTVEYIAHAPLEPRAALAEWTEGQLTVWTGTQRPFGVRAELAEAFRIPEDKIRVLHPDMGSGYGGKHTGETAIEAARLAKAAGKPVKLVWTRAEEFAWAYFRPAGVIDVASGARKDGTLTAWDFHNYNSGGSGIEGKYAIENQRTQFHRTESPLRQGSYRGLAATANHFARESHLDDVAHSLGLDPLEFRRKNLRDQRMLAVLDAAAKTFGWGQEKSTPERGFGLACGFEKAGYVACCAEVAIDRARKSVRVVRVVESFECGAIIHPDHLHHQVEGAIVQGLGGALFEAIRFENGRILNGRFGAYRVPRFSDLPKIQVVLVDRPDLPSAGAGETPNVGIAPAIGNALFAATGQRLRSLPLVPDGLKV